MRFSRFASGLTLSLSLPALAAQTYTITQLATPAGFSAIYPDLITNQGIIVGDAYGPAASQAIIWNAGISLVLPNASGGSAHARAGSVSGTVGSDSFPARCILTK